MKLLIVLEYFYNVDRPVGGAERQVNKLAKRFIEAGLDVTLVAGQWKWQEARHEVINTIPVSRIFTCWNMFDTRGLRKFGHYTYLVTLFFYLYRNRKNYDFIHCHSAMASAFATAIDAGRTAFRSGLMQQRQTASPSTPTVGQPFWHKK